MFEERVKAAAGAMFENWEVGLGIARLGVAAADAVGAEPFKLAKRPVEFLVTDKEGGGLLFNDEAIATAVAGQWGVSYQGLDVRDGTPAAQEFLEPQTEPMSAKTSPGPVNCSIRLRFHNEAYPRTCARCGLGPCPFFNNDGTAKPR